MRGLVRRACGDAGVGAAIRGAAPSGAAHKRLDATGSTPQVGNTLVPATALQLSLNYFITIFNCNHYKCTGYPSLYT